MNSARHARPVATRHPLRSGAWVGCALAAAALWPALAGAASCRDRTPTSWDIDLTPPNEPGDPFVLSGRVLNAADRKPLANITVYVHHADLHGRYNPQGNEAAEPRLCGVLRTNANGQYRVRTTMPGGYGGYPPHVHFEYWGKRVSRQHAFVNLKLKPVPTGSSGRKGERTPAAAPPPREKSNLWQYTPNLRDDRTAIERPVERGADGVWTCTRDLLVH